MTRLGAVIRGKASDLTSCITGVLRPVEKPLSRFPSPLPSELTVYTSFMGQSAYTPAVLQLVEDYFIEEVGLRINFQPSTSDSDQSLDHRTRIALKEVKLQDLEDAAVNEIDTRYAAAETELVERINAIKGNALPEYLDTFRDLLGTLHILKGKKEYELSHVRRRGKLRFGDSKMEESTAYLVDGRAIEGVLTELMQGKKLSPEFLRDYLTKFLAKTIVHEIGHLAGLWHTADYKNDGLSDKVGKLPNVMSMLPPNPDEKYGFTITPSQQNHLRSFFLGGGMYRMAELQGFNFQQYLENLAQKRDYKSKAA